MPRSPQSFPARTWQPQDQPSGGTATTATATPLLSNAASSGFSHSATHPPSSSTATLHPSLPFLNLNMPGLYVIHPSEYASHHHHDINRSQPPPQRPDSSATLKVRVFRTQYHSAHLFPSTQVAVSSSCLTRFAYTPQEKNPLLILHKKRTQI